MKVLVDNYNTKDTEKLHKLTCEICSSELQYDQSDIEIGEYGLALIECPLCGRLNYLEDGEHDVTLTKDNVVFPTHFYHTSKENGAVDVCNNENVKKAINQAIEYFRQNKDAYNWCTMSGNLCVFIYRLDGDEEYSIWVTNNYYETSIPFEQEDYDD